MPALPRLDWHGVRGKVDEVSAAQRDGACNVYTLRISPQELSCALDFVSGDVDGSVGARATEPQSVRLELPLGMKPPVAVGHAVCAMYDWVDDGKHRIWDSALVARDGRVLFLGIENGALELGGFRSRDGIAHGGNHEFEFFRLIVDHPGGSTELRPRTPVTKTISGRKYYLVADAFRRRLEAPGLRDRGAFYALVAQVP
jgi:hypothetical protein